MMTSFANRIEYCCPIQFWIEYHRQLHRSLDTGPCWVCWPAWHNLLQSAFTPTSSFRNTKISSNANRTTGFQPIKEPVLTREPAFNREPTRHREPAVNRDLLPANGQMIEQVAYGKPSRLMQQESLVSNADDLNITNNNYKSHDFSSTTSFFDVDSVSELSRSSSKAVSSLFKCSILEYTENLEHVELQNVNH